MFTVIAYLLAGVIGLIVTLVGVPARVIFALWSGRGQRASALSEPEQNLRRASRAAGCAALLILAAIAYNALGGELSVIATIIAPGDAGLLALAYTFLLGVCLVLFILGVIGCWGLRNRELVVRAFITFAFGLGLTLYLWLHFPLTQRPIWPATWEMIPSWALASWPQFAAQAGFVIGLWLVVTGLVRFVLLVQPTTPAQRIIRRELRERNAPLVAPRRRQQ